LLVLLQSIQCSPLTTTARLRHKAYRHTTMVLRWAHPRKGVSSRASPGWGNLALTQATYSSPISRCQGSSRRRCRTLVAFQGLQCRGLTLLSSLPLCLHNRRSTVCNHSTVCNNSMCHHPTRHKRRHQQACRRQVSRLDVTTVPLPASSCIHLHSKRHCNAACGNAAQQLLLPQQNV
jgi:hypothetical protein